MLVVFRLFLCGFNLFSESKAHENAVKRAGISCISFFFPKFTVKLTNWNVGVSPMVILDPFQFFFRMCIRMRRVRTMGFWNERFSRSVIDLVPTHKRCFGYVVSTTYEIYVMSVAVQIDRTYFCWNLVWTKSFCCGIMFHRSDWVLSVEFVRGNIIPTESNHFFYCFFIFSLTTIVTLQLQ